jgi:hypothetical protein
MRDLRRKKHPSGSCSQEAGIAAPSEHEAAVRALHDAWTERLVEGLHLCPFARASREQGRSAVHLWEGEVPGAAGDARVEDALAQFFRACLADEKAEVVQVIVPGLSIEPLVWEKVAKAYHALLRPLHPDGGWAVAAFHPKAPFGVSSAAALVPLFRRSPFPTIQWLRLSVLERVREAAQAGTALDLAVNAGHGLNYYYVQPIARIPEIVELNIGHAIVARAIFDGLSTAVIEMKRLMTEARLQ